MRIWTRLSRGPGSRAKDFSDKAVCEYKQGDWEGAVLDLRKAIELAPNSLEAYASLAAVYASRGLRDQALDVYDRGLAVKPLGEHQSLRRQLVEGKRMALRSK